MSEARQATDAGLTLLEMVIVLAVIAVVSGAAVVALAPTRGDAVEAEARRLAAAVQSEADRTLAVGETSALVVETGAYRVGSAPSRALPPDVHVTPAGTIALGEGRPFVLAFAGARTRWQVAFDGLRAVARETAG